MCHTHDEVAPVAPDLTPGEFERRLAAHGHSRDEVCVATYAVQELADFWPEGASDSGEIHGGLTTIATAGLVAGALLLAWRPQPANTGLFACTGGSNRCGFEDRSGGAGSSDADK